MKSKLGAGVASLLAVLATVAIAAGSEGGPDGDRTGHERSGESLECGEIAFHNLHCPMGTDAFGLAVTDGGQVTRVDYAPWCTDVIDHSVYGCPVITAAD